MDVDHFTGSEIAYNPIAAPRRLDGAAPHNLFDVGDHLPR